MSYVDIESELLPYLLQIGELDWVESSRTLRHRHTVPRNRVSHVVVVDQILQRSLFDITSTSPPLVHHLPVHSRLNVVVFQQMGSDIIDP